MSSTDHTNVSFTTRTPSTTCRRKNRLSNNCRTHKRTSFVHASCSLSLSLFLSLSLSLSLPQYKCVSVLQLICREIIVLEKR